jgi:fermentation-respiration switch protein FrsA (DUF1100 family)
VFEHPAWRIRLRQNRLGTLAPAVPVLLHHARRDQIVSFAQSAKLHDDWEHLGVDVRLRVTRGGIGHLSGAVAGTPRALGWIARQLKGGGQPAMAVVPRARPIVQPVRSIGRKPLAEAA